MDYFVAENIKEDFASIQIDVSFSCQKGSMTSILGPSGSGKSTVLRLISGLNRGKEGQKIILDGQDISFLPPAKRNVGLVFQNHTLFDHLNVLDNVSYGLISGGMSKKVARKEALNFLKLFELEGFEKRYPGTLSGGEAQRVCLARTLIMKPKLLLLDEALSALDKPLRKKLAQLIKDLQNRFNFTAIMVTHDQEEAKELSDQIIKMQRGKIIWQGKACDFELTD